MDTPRTRVTLEMPKVAADKLLAIWNDPIAWGKFAAYMKEQGFHVLGVENLQAQTIQTK